MEDVRKTQTKILEKKITMPELKNIMDGINRRSDISEEMNSKLEGIAIKTTKNETQSEKELKKKSNNNYGKQYGSSLKK